MNIKATTPKGTYPSPFAHQRCVAEQRGFDREHIEASHIGAPIYSLEHQHLQLVSGYVARIRHGATVATRWDVVQRIS